MGISRGRRRLRFPGPDDKPVEPSRLRFTVAFPDGASALVDFADAPLPSLASELGECVKRLARVGGAAGTPKSVETCCSSLRRFLRAAAEENDPPRSLGRLTPNQLSSIEERMRHGSAEDSRSPYTVMWYFRAALLEWAQRWPGDVSEEMLERLAYVADGPVGSTTPRNPYSRELEDRIRAACRDAIAAIVKRIYSGEALVARGQDPNESGWAEPANVLWEISRVGIVRYGELAACTSHYVAHRCHLSRAHRLLYPTQADLVPFFILLMLETGLEPECARGLSSTCLINEAGAFADVEYVKRRVRGDPHKRLRELSDGAESPGGIIKLVKRVTVHVRRWHNSDSLWVAYDTRGARFFDAALDISSKNCPFDEFARSYALLDDVGQPLRVVPARLRKTQKDRRWVDVNGNLEEFPEGHTPEVAARFYAATPARRAFHEDVVRAGLEDAEALGRNAGPSAKRSQAAAAGARNPDRMHAQMDMGTPAVQSASTTFPEAGSDRSEAPRERDLVECLRCSNAVVMERHLPRQLIELDALLDQRSRLGEDAWLDRFGEKYVRISSVLERFSEDELLLARALAEASRPLTSLPADFGSATA